MTSLAALKCKILVMALMLAFAQKGHAQKQVQKFEITVAGFKIGNLTASAYHKGDSLYYELESQVSFWFFGRINLEVDNKSVYYKDQFIASTVATNSNKGNFLSTVKWEGDHYKADANTYKYELKNTIQDPAYFSSSRLHFEEPVDHNKFLAENYGLISPIEKKKDYYEVDVNGNRNRYYYVNGNLERAVIENPIKNYVIKRID